MMKNLDRWLTIIAIVVMILGAVFLYFESKKCNNPLKIIIENMVEEENLKYATVEIKFYDDGLLVSSYRMNSEGEFIPFETSFTYPNSKKFNASLINVSE